LGLWLQSHIVSISFLLIRSLSYLEREKRIWDASSLVKRKQLHVTVNVIWTSLTNARGLCITNQIAVMNLEMRKQMMMTSNNDSKTLSLG
jgi:cAMP phosphodiesterase